MEKGEQSTTVTRKTKVRCGVQNCDVTSSTHPEYSFYTVPKNTRRDIWLKAIKAPLIAETTRIQVCEKHFEKKFINFNHIRRRLTRWAVPTLFLPDKECVFSFANNDDFPESEGVSLDSDSAALNDDEEIPDEIHEEKISVSNFSMTSDHIHPSIDKVTTLMPVKVEPIDPEAPSTSSSTYVIPVKRKQSESFENTGPTKVVKIKQEKNDLSVFVDEDSEEEYHEDTVIAKQLQDLAEFQNQQNVEVKEKSSKQKYTTAYKMCALELYFKSPNSYRLFQRTFSLPKISTLYRLCIPAATDLNQNVLTALGIKVNSMTEAQKECVVCVATMRLTPHIEYDAVNDKMFGFQELDGVQTLEPARSILVIAVRGLFHNWKQALGFLLLSHFQNRLDVNRFVDEVIRKLIDEIKLNVRVLMTDLQSDMSSASWNRRFDVTSPYFFIGKKKIYYMYEPLNLMKNVRDYLMHNSIVFYNGMGALWLHLVQCYEYDRKKKLMRLAPKLSQDHVIFKKKKEAKDDLKYTADVFSRATATAIATCIDLKVLDTQAKDTALWILTMSQLLDILNFSTIDPPEDRSAVYSGTTKQVEFLVEMITMFSKLQTTNASFKEGFMVTINALLLLYEELKTEYKDCLPIIGLSHDCLNNFFNKCRHELVVPPTAKQVVTTMTKLPIFNIFQYSLNKRSPGDLEMFLSLVRQMPDNMYEERAEPFVDSCAATSAEFPSVPLTKDKKLEHLALYLLYKGYREHCECERMKAYVRSKDIIENLNNVMPLVGYNTQISGGKFKMVPEEFVAFLEALEVKFKEYFKENRLARSIAGLMSFIQGVTFEMPCECFPIDYIKRLYLGYRLYNVIEYNNKMFKKVTENCEAAFVVNDL